MRRLLNCRFRSFLKTLTACFVAVSVCPLAGCASQSSRRVENPVVDVTIKPPEHLVLARQSVERFFPPKTEPEPSDWLATYNEPGQTFEEYLNSNPTTPTFERNKLYVLPLGDFTQRQKKAITIASGYLRAFYDVDVEIMPAQKIPRPLRIKDSRINQYSRNEQVRTGFILDSILVPILPSDAAALIAFTNEDLFPDETMNYVFGQATFEKRVGVWSLFRLDDPNFETFLSRTIKIAAHETGHMFSMHHCRKYECVMNGSNHLDETDRQPLEVCPECMAKVCWLSKISPAQRYKNLIKFCEANKMKKYAADFLEKLDAVKGQN